MNLTSAQLTTLKTWLTANASGVPDEEAAALANAVASPPFFVWRTAVSVQDIYDQIQWSKLTPADAPVATFSDAGIAWQNRALMCQAKQFNLQVILQGQSIVNATKANVRAGLQDALTNVPSAAGGATQSAGWVQVRDIALARAATVGEKLFADTAGGNGSTAQVSAMLGPEGKVTASNVSEARNQ